MTREEIGRKLEEIKQTLPASGTKGLVIAIIFADGERHLAHIWSVEYHTSTLMYKDIHSAGDYTKVFYHHITDIQSYVKSEEK